MKQKENSSKILTVLFLGVLMGALDIAIVGPALPNIGEYFHIGDRLLAWVFTIYVLFNLVGTPLMAKLSDRFGRRNVYTADVVIFAIGALTVALAPNFHILLTGRAIQGLGAGGIFPVASAVIGDTFPPEKRGSALGMIGAVFGLAFIIGPIIGGILLMFGWRWLFLINIPVALVVIAMGWKILPSTRPQIQHPFDWFGMTVLSVMLAALTFGISQIDTAAFIPSLLSRNVWPFIAVAIILLFVFAGIEKSAQDPVIRPSLFSTGQLRLANFLSFGAGLGEAGLVFIPSLAIAAFGVSKSAASFMLLPLVFAMAVGSPLAGRLLDRYGSKLVIVSGTILLTGGMILLGFMSHSMVSFYAATIIVGLGLAALLGAPVRYIMLHEAPASDRAAAQGVITVFTGVGQLVSGAMVGAVAASMGGGVSGYSAAYLAISGVAFVLILASLLLKNRQTELATLTRQQTVPDQVAVEEVM